jgi:flagellar biogenesis protein FliO
MGAIFLFLFFMWLFKGFGKAMKHSEDSFRPDK